LLHEITTADIYAKNCYNEGLAKFEPGISE